MNASNRHIRNNANKPSPRTNQLWYLYKWKMIQNKDTRNDTTSKTFVTALKEFT